MAIISENEAPVSRRYTNSQLRYALGYVLITLVALLVLNLYCSKSSQNIFYQSKRSMIEKCQLASDEISKLEIRRTNKQGSANCQQTQFTGCRKCTGNHFYNRNARFLIRNSQIPMQQITQV